MVRKYRSIALPASCLFILQIGCTDLLYFRSIFFNIKWKCIVIKATHTFIVVIQSIHKPGPIIQVLPLIDTTYLRAHYVLGVHQWVCLLLYLLLILS